MGWVVTIEFCPTVWLFCDYAASALIGKYSRTLYSKIYAPFVENTPVANGVHFWSHFFGKVPPYLDNVSMYNVYRTNSIQKDILNIVT